MSEAYETSTEYPPANWEVGDAFTAPGPVSRPLENYLAMCSPRRQRRRVSAMRLRDEARLALAGVGSVN